MRKLALGAVLGGAFLALSTSALAASAPERSCYGGACECVYWNALSNDPHQVPNLSVGNSIASWLAGFDLAIGRKNDYLSVFNFIRQWCAAHPGGTTEMALKRYGEGVLLQLERSTSGSRADNVIIPPINIQNEIKSRLCADAVLNDGFLTYNKNPHYFVIDYGHVVCDGSSRYYWGSAGCLTQIFVMRPSGEYEKVLDSNVRELKFVQVGGRPAMSIALHGSACDLTGADVCRKTVGLGETR